MQDPFPGPLNPALMDIINSKEWTPWYKNSEQIFMRIKNKTKNRGVLDPQETENNFFPWSCFTVHVCVVLHLHIEGVLSKGHLLKKGEVVKEEIWWAEVKSQEDDRDQKVKRRQPHFWTLVLAAKSSIGHQMTSSPWPEVSQDSFTDWDHLLINCVFTHDFFYFLFLLVHTPFFFLFLAFLHFLGRFVVSKWPVKPKYPYWTLHVIKGRQGLWQHNRKTTWPFVCIFVCVCAHVCVYVWLSVLGRAGVWSCTQVYCTIQLPLFATVEN